MMIGELLAETRKLHGDRQEDLAKKLGVSLSAVRSWEQEKSSPGHKALTSICRMYQVSADYLLGLTRTDHPEEFTREELAQIRQFESFLLWKRSHPIKRP